MLLLPQALSTIMHLSFPFICLCSDCPESFIKSSQFSFVKQLNPNGLFVTEAKQQKAELAKHIPQAMVEIYASAKYLSMFKFLLILIANKSHSFSKSILCGTVTNGHEWIFLIFYLNKDGIGGTYKKSCIVKM
jgi:hypothetical protein